MSGTNKMREWATPVTMGAFLLSGITGVLLFFKVRVGMTHLVHEWLSWLLVIGAVFHLIANWRTAWRYFSRPVGRVVMGIFLLLLIGTLVIPGGGGEHRERRQYSQAPDTALADTAPTPDEAPSPAGES